MKTPETWQKLSGTIIDHSLLTIHHLPLNCKFVVMTIQEANYYLLNRLRRIYPEGEVLEITDWVMEHLTSSKKVERMLEQLDGLNGKTI